ncbi:MAG: hypothetical protein MI923_29005 [Phycisphaerales bacterium]|nr:hypothetical protein [Phycisphaerales bacterium]
MKARRFVMGTVLAFFFLVRGCTVFLGDECTEGTQAGEEGACPEGQVCTFDSEVGANVCRDGSLFGL